MLQSQIIRDLGDGLILRRATSQDSQRLARFSGEVHRDPGATRPDGRTMAWVRDLAERPHPTFDVGDFTIVEDIRNGTIVSTLCLISQTWSFDGVELAVGQPELVGTHPDYRNRGLIRKQFDVVHGWSAQRGEKLQAIDGIPFFYRQFGYELALDISAGRLGYEADVPKLDLGRREPYLVRAASRSDTPFLDHLSRRGNQRYRVCCVRNEALWEHEIGGRSSDSAVRREIAVIQTTRGEPIGFLVYEPFLTGSTLTVNTYELQDGESWASVTPSILRYLAKKGHELAAQSHDGRFSKFALRLGSDHPAYQLSTHLLPVILKPYAWYIRIPDLPDFIRTVAPALERRLSESALSGHNGRLDISFYRTGLEMIFENGRLMEAEPRIPSASEAGGARFPGLAFLQLLLGYRTIEDLEYSFADCRVPSDEARALLSTLFPRQGSSVWSIV